MLQLLPEGGGFSSNSWTSFPGGGRLINNQGSLQSVSQCTLCRGIGMQDGLANTAGYWLHSKHCKD